jgi:ribosome-associated protein
MIGGCDDRRVDEISVDRDIRLGQLLKLADLVESGGDAKAVLRAGQVRVNGRVDVRRGRRLAPGDVVQVGDRSLRLT